MSTEAATESGPTTPLYQVLGASAATLSLLLETLRRRHPDGARVTVVRNAAAPADELAWETPGIDTRTLAHDDWAAAERSAAPCLCGVYRPGTKQAVVDFFARHHGVAEEHYAALRHPGVEVAATVDVGAGTYLGPGVVIAPYARLGRLVSVNRAATIGHHTTLDDFCTLNPGVHIAGRCRLGTGVTVGMGASLVDGITVGDGAVIGAGSLVTRDLPAGMLAYGAPARVIGPAR